MSSESWLIDYDAFDEKTRRLILAEDNDITYINYVETTIDLGNKLFEISLVISVCSLACVPLLAKLGKCILQRSGCKCKKSNSSEDGDDDCREHHADDAASATSARGNQTSRADLPESRPSFVRRASSRSVEVADSLVRYFLVNALKSRKRGAYNTEAVAGRQMKITRCIEREARASMHFHQHKMEALKNQGDITQEADVGVVVSPLPDGSEKVGEPIGEQATQSAFPPMQMTDPKGILHFMWEVGRYDREFKRILRLAIPFSCSAVAKTGSELIILAIVSNTLGTDSMVAYSMTFGLVGITFSFMGGWFDSVSTLASMAYGAENYTLAGAYVQTACISYILCDIPMGLIWYFTMSKILLLMGYEVSVADLGHDFVWVRVMINMTSGLNQCILNFLECIEHEVFSNVMFCVGAISNAGFVALAAYLFDVNLVFLGLVTWVNASIVFFIIVFVPIKLGWVEKFEMGLFGACAWTDMSISKDVFKVALPLAFGSLLAYAEWETLTIFAATLGPAEAATWSVMGFVWDVFESTTEAIGDASEVRVAYQLGRGRPAMAKLSAYKCILLGLVVSILISIVTICLTDVLPVLLTRDSTIQSMLTELIPFVALGNVTMSMGMVAWTIIGAQGRYHLSTSVALAISCVVTIPIGAVLSIGMNINLQGLAFAVVTGYSVTAMILFALILMSDWEMLSEKVQEQVAAGDLSLSDSSGDESSCSSVDSDSERISKPPISSGCDPNNF